MIVLTFPPVGQFSSFPPHSVNIFPTTRPHVSGQCPAPRSGVRNVHHTSVLFPGRIRPGHRLIGRPHPRGVHRRGPEGINSWVGFSVTIPEPRYVPEPRYAEPIATGKWSVPAHHHATVGRWHGQHPPAPLSHRVGTVRDLDGSDRPCQPGQPARGPFHPVDHQRL